MLEIILNWEGSHQKGKKKKRTGLGHFGGKRKKKGGKKNLAERSIWEKPRDWSRRFECPGKKTAKRKRKKVLGNVENFWGGGNDREVLWGRGGTNLKKDDATKMQGGLGEPNG